MAHPRKIALVTGCSKGGIGFSLCEEFVTKGCTVYATARRLSSMDALDSEHVHKLELDVTRDESVQAAVKIVIEREGQIDILVNNAGMSNSSPVIDVSMAEIIQIYDTNVFSVLRMAKAVIPHMAARKSGTIVNIGSIGGEVPTPWNGIYCSSKAAVHSITDTLYMECTPLNIDVVLVSPGAVKSNIAANQADRVGLPPESLYRDYIDAVLTKLNMSQASNPMPSAVFAREVVGGVLQARPPRFMTMAPMSGWTKIFLWLPRGWVLRLLWKRLGEGPRKATSK